MRCINKMVTAEAFEKGILFYAPLEHGAPPTELFLCVPHEKPLRVPVGYYVVRDGCGAIGRLSPALFRDIYEELPADNAGDSEEG